jgi:CBS domain-containing protein
LTPEVIQMIYVRDVMTRSVRSVRPDAPLREVAQLLIDERISGVPVADDEGRVLGVVSEADFLIKERGPAAIRHRRFERLLGEAESSRAELAKLGATTAGEAMTSPAVTIGPGRQIAEAARLMSARGINRLPVVDTSRLVGIVTRADLLRAYVRPDHELERTIREDVLLRMLWLDPAGFDVTVKNGVATIVGRVDRRSMSEMIDDTVRMVPGLIDVRTDIAWATDDRRLEPAVADPVFPHSF